jgi:hypothetical protein
MPRIFTPAVLLVNAFLAGSVSPVFAQSLADAARQEEQRRQGVKAPGKVISNKDLSSPPSISAIPTAHSASPDGAVAAAGNPELPGASGGAGAAAQSADAPSAGAAAGKTGGASDQATKDASASAKGQKYWSDRMRGLQDELARNRTFAEALQSRINALTTDFVNRDDPKQREGIAKDRQKALDELERVKKAIIDGPKAIADLEEEARRSGVPAGWLR